MKKSELKSGMLTLNRRGEFGLVLLGTENGDVIAGNGTAHADWTDLDTYYENLNNISSGKDRDIVAVYQARANRYRASFDIDPSHRTLLWERKKSVLVELNDKYNAEVNLDTGRVTVGCQTFTFDKIEALYKATQIK